MTSEKQVTAFFDLREQRAEGGLCLSDGNWLQYGLYNDIFALFAGQNLGLSVGLIGLLIASRTPLALLQSYTGTLDDKYRRRILVFAGSTAGIISTISYSIPPIFS